MQPILKIGPLTQLQDARYSSAVGFDIISFSLVRGDMSKLSPAMVWNIVQWLDGPKICLDIDANSLPELSELEEQFNYNYLSVTYDDLPAIRDWSALKHPLIIHCDASVPVENIRNVLKEFPKQSLIELHLNSISQLEAFSGIQDRSLVHMAELETTLSLGADSSLIPGGIALGKEAEEDEGMLDFERIDTLIDNLMELGNKQ